MSCPDCGRRDDELARLRACDDEPCNGCIACLQHALTLSGKMIRDLKAQVRALREALINIVRLTDDPNVGNDEFEKAWRVVCDVYTEADTALTSSAHAEKQAVEAEARDTGWHSEPPAPEGEGR